MMIIAWKTWTMFIISSEVTRRIILKIQQLILSTNIRLWLLSGKHINVLSAKSHRTLNSWHIKC